MHSFDRERSSHAASWPREYLLHHYNVLHTYRDAVSTVKHDKSRHVLLALSSPLLLLKRARSREHISGQPHGLAHTCRHEGAGVSSSSEICTELVRGLVGRRAVLNPAYSSLLSHLRQEMDAVYITMGVAM